MKTVQEMVQEVVTAEPKVETIVDSPGYQSLKIILPYNCYIYGSIPADDRNKTAWVGTMFVNPKLQKNGIGKRLLKLFLKECITRGLQLVAGYSFNYNGFKAVLNILGDKRIMLKDINTGEPVSIKHYTDNKEDNFQVWVDIRDLKTEEVM